MVCLTLAIANFSKAAPAMINLSAAESLASTVERNYVDEATGREMATAIRHSLAAGTLDVRKPGPEFARDLQACIRQKHYDPHLLVMYSRERIPPMDPLTYEAPLVPDNGMRSWMQAENYGVPRVEILAGNIGLIEFSLFAPLNLSAATYDAAFKLVEGTQGLMIDLRRCRGSLDPTTLPYLISFFLPKKQILARTFWRPTGEVREVWSWESVAGPRYLNRPVVVLTSHSTFSGGETFAKDLQRLKVAHVVGERTPGGSHFGGTVRLNDHFTAFIPAGKGIGESGEPETVENSVHPDLPSLPRSSHKLGHLHLLRQIAQGTQDPARRMELEQHIQELENSEEPVVPTTFRLKGHVSAKSVGVVGSFNYWSALSYQMKWDGTAWTGTFDIPPGRHAYKFLVDGNYVADPMAPEAPNSPHGDSLLVVPFRLRG